MQDDASIPEQTSGVTAVNSSNWRRTAIAIVITALVTGTGGYLLGIRANQNASQSTQEFSFQPSPTITAQSSVSAPSPVPITADWKMYMNSDGLYSFRYPSDWNVNEEKRNEDISEVIVLAPRTEPCPSNVKPFTCETAESIYIEIIENSANNASITDFLNQKFGQLKPTYTPVTINGVEGLRTSDIPGRFSQEHVFIKNKTKIYRIVWIRNQATKQISTETFNKILSTFKFTY